MKLADKTVLLTGAGSGLGAALAPELARRGANLVLAGRREDKLRATAARCAGVRCEVVPTDLMHFDQLERLVSTTIERFGQLDVLINNAGVGYGGYAEDIAPEEVAHNVQVNLTSPIWLIQLCLPHLLRASEANITNVISLSGIVAAPAQSVYVASKFGLRGYSESLRRDLGSAVHVLEIYPGAMDTELNTPEMRDRAKQQGLDVKAQDPAQVAREIVRAIESDKKLRIIAPMPDRALPAVLSLAPQLIDKEFQKVKSLIRAFMLEGNRWVRSRTPLTPLVKRGTS